MKKKQRVLSAIVFMALIFIMPLLFFFSEKHIYSAEENRPLAKCPHLTLSNIVSKRYMNDLARYFSDNFPARMGFVKAKMGIDRLTGKQVENGIYLGDGMLIEKLKKPDYNSVNKSITGINRFAENYPHTRVSFMLAPTSAGIYTDRLPDSAPQPDQKEFIEDVYSNISSKVQKINVFDTINSSRDDYIYYRTDHHWTSLGAYLAYRQAASSLGFVPTEKDRFTVEQATDDFRGTFYKKCFCSSVPPDIIDIYTDRSGAKVTEVLMDDGINTQKSGSIYFREFLDGSDKYSVFLGQNRAFTKVKTNSPTGKKILVIKDSYANSFIPFLVNNYSEIGVIDLRYVKGSIKRFTDPNSYGQTLFLYNASTFAEDKNVRMAGFTQ